MTKWDYKVGAGLKPDDLKEYGSYGWELVSVITYSDASKLFYFKRPIEEPVGSDSDDPDSRPRIRS